MEKCVFCGNEIASMIGYFADGDARVCSLCCSRYTIATYINRVKATGIAVNTKDVFTPAYNARFVVDADDIADADDIDKHVLNAAYGMTVDTDHDPDDTGITDDSIDSVEQYML